jgi:hypothetical protein
VDIFVLQFGRQLFDGVGFLYEYGDLVECEFVALLPDDVVPDFDVR